MRQQGSLNSSLACSGIRADLPKPASFAAFQNSEAIPPCLKFWFRIFSLHPQFEN
jgi:hypothetical protein